jgi:hypothetical protein
MSAVSTEGRVFAAQLTRDLLAREAAGANLLSPGCQQWLPAFHAFVDEIVKAKSPTRAGVIFKAGVGRLHQAQEGGACFVNMHMSRSRSGGFEVLTWERAKHPLTQAGNDGIVVQGYHCLLQRKGCVRLGFTKLAFCSWHALARMRERSKIDIFDSRGVVAGCGIAGRLMRMSDKHDNGGIYYAAGESLLCAGVLRTTTDDRGQAYAFYDVLTAFQPNEDGPQVAQWRQGCAIAWAVHEYITGDSADPSGYADKIDVLPFRYDDFTSRELKRVS